MTAFDLISCKLIGTFCRDSVPPLAWRRVIRCGPRSGGTAGRTISSGRGIDHPLAKLGRAIAWRFLEERFGAVYSDKAGHPPLPTRLMAGLSILKHMHDLSDEDLCARWVENPYYQLFCGEEFFQHQLTFDRSSLTRWRQRMEEERLTALIQESLAVATRTGAAKPADLSKVIVDTTVQPKAVAFPTDAKLMHRARERLVKLAKKTSVGLRQSYERVGKHALIAHQRYAHAKQFKRANRALKTIRTYLGRVTRDIVRKIKADADLESAFARPLMLARRVREQRQHQRGPKVYSLHAPEVECIGKGKAHRPYEFGVKVSLATTLHRSKGGQFIAHAKALPGNPYDGHTLATVIPEIEAQIGATLSRIVADRGYRGHNARPQVQGLYLRPETRRHRDHQTRTPPPLRGRTGHWPRQVRAPHGPKLPRRDPRRRRQRRSRRRRLQLQTPARMAGPSVVLDPRRVHRRGQ